MSINNEEPSRAPASLLSLPLELRNHVYRHAYGLFRVLTYKRQPSFRSEVILVSEENPCMDSQLVCKQLLKEISAFCCSRPIILNLVGMDRWPLDSFGLRTELREFVKEVHIEFRNPSNGLKLRTSMDAVCAGEHPFGPELRNLELVTFTAYGPESQLHTAMISNILMLLCHKIVYSHPRLTKMLRIEHGEGKDRRIRFQVTA